MENLLLDKFEPKKAELETMVKDYSNLTITDKESFESVKQARIHLKKTRVDIQKTWKQLRDDANAWAKAVIAKEKEYISIIEPLENKLQDEEDKYTLEIEKKKRLADLPNRKMMIEWLWELTDDEILSMDDTQFSKKLFELKSIKLQEEERIKNEKIEAERIEVEKQKMIKEAEERATIEAERKAQAEIDRIKREAEEKENQRIIEEKRKEEERIEAERKAQEEQEKIRKNKLYQDFLNKNDYNETNFIIQNNNWVIKLYKLIDTLTLS